ncbi:hypothetical protein [Metaclostridioides mangenotii]|nr:hypothetical protein [Clostridioides mangenotii]
MIQLLNNPSDEGLIDSFKDMPAQLVIGLTLQALIKYFGMG